MKILLSSIILLLFAACISYAQEKVVLNNADSLTGRMENGEQVRIAIGNVQFTQGNIRVFCNSATEYVNQNRVDLSGNVRIFQDTLSLFTSRAVYYGNEKRAVCEGGVTLQDPNAQIRSDRGTYFFDDARAIFSGNVIIVNPEYNITSRELTYLRNTEDSFAKGNVTVTTDSAIIKAANVDFLKRQGRTFAYGNVSVDNGEAVITADSITNYKNESRSVATGNVTITSDSTVITSDSLVNFSAEKRTVASNRVKIVDLRNSTLIFGDKVENFELTDYTILTGNAQLISVKQNEDTLFLYSSTMEAFRTPPDERYVAKDSVEAIRGDFSAKGGIGIYFRQPETLTFSINPAVWQNANLGLGDSIVAHLPGRQVETLYLIKLDTVQGSLNSLLVNRNEVTGFRKRFDQVSSRNMTIWMGNDGKIDSAAALEDAESIYYAYEQDSLAAGMNNLSGDYLSIFFDANEDVTRAVVKGAPVGTFKPENLLSAEGEFLDNFRYREDKPVKKPIPER